MAMVHTWMRWCRICAHENVDSSEIGSGSQATPHLFESVNQFLSKKISCEDNLPHNVCTPCEQQITSIVSFIDHASNVQAMFLELADNADDVNVNAIRSRFLKASDEVDQKDSKENIVQPLAEQLIDDMKPILGDCMNPIKIKEELEFDDDEWANEREADGAEDNKSKNSSDSEESSKEDSAKERAPYFCSECCMFYTQFHSYRNHMQLKHNRALSPLRLPCSICNETHTTLTQLKRHMAKHVHQERNTCPHCGEIFLRSRLLRDHIQKAHKIVKRYICEQCGKSCRNALTLEEHELTHKGIIYHCRTCDKTFRTKYTLRIHEDTHSNSYVCQVCGLQLNTKRTLYMHRLVHSDQKTHKCNYCGKEYKRAKTLKAHLICHTDLMPYKCNFCGRYFKNGSNCRTHIKNSHPDELAVAEANGSKTTTSNIPTLKQLRIVTSIKVEDTTFSDHRASDEGNSNEA